MRRGLPAKVLRPLSEDEIRWKLEGTRTYQQLTQRCLASLEEVQPLPAAEADRPSLPASLHQPLHTRRQD